MIDRLEAIVGPGNVVKTEEEMEPYAHDETLGQHFMPAVVAKPENSAQVADILKLAAGQNIPITPRGAGTGLSGGALPVHGGILLSLERLNRILEIDEDNLTVTVQPAVITKVLQDSVEEKGLFYPPDPASLESCSIGGNVAENAGGPRAFKYGVTRHYLCGLEVVWPSGEISRLGGKTIKNVTGYDLMQLICGSEGTLAVATEISLRLLPKPRLTADLMIPFPSIERAVAASTAMLHQRVVPAAMEFMEKKAVQASEKFLEKRAPFPEAEAHLLIQLDGNDREQIRREYEIVGEVALSHNALEVLVAEDRPTQDRIWEIRRALSEALTQKSPIREREDVVVPRARIPELFQAMSEIQSKRGVEIISFGHIGDGNIHVNVLKEAIDQDTWERTLPRVLDDLFAAVLGLGGTISGEHGIGFVKKRFLPKAVDPAALEMMRALKKAVDPKGILNPGKIFP
jgi:glycolate oxidase